MSGHFVSDTAALTGRSLRHIARSPDTIITTTIMPIAFMLMFVYVFGGAMNTRDDAYVNYLLPGILLITIASSIAYTAFRLFMDKSSGIVERFQSMPIARSAVLWAHVLTSRASSQSSSWCSSPCSWGSDPARALWRGSRSRGSWRCSPSR